MGKSLGKQKAQAYTPLLITAALVQCFYEFYEFNSSSGTIRPLKNDHYSLLIKADLNALTELVIAYHKSKHFLPHHQAIATEFNKLETTKQEQIVKDLIRYLFDLELAINYIPEANSKKRHFSIHFPYRLIEYRDPSTTIKNNLQWLMQQWQERSSIQNQPQLTITVNLDNVEHILNLFPKSLYDYTQNRIQVLTPIVSQLLQITQQNNPQYSSELIIHLVRFLIANHQLTKANDLLNLSDCYLPKKSFHLDLILSDRDYYRGLICLKNKDLVSAETFLQQAITTRQKRLGNIHPLVAEAVHAMGAVFLEKLEFNQAITCFQITLAIRQKLPPSPEIDLAIANATNSLGNVLANRDYTQHDYPKALSLYAQAMNLSLQHTDCHVFLASSHIGQANLYARHAYYDLAKYHYTEAIAILEKIFGIDHPESEHPKQALDAILGINNTC